jgi:hypothetical protein
MEAESKPARAYLRVGERKVPIPRTKAMRILLGTWFVIAGVIPLVPPGVGMLPVGFMLISIDYPRLRRPRRRMVVWGGRKLKALLARMNAKLARHKPAV